MKLKVSVAGQLYEVEIDDLDARPVIAFVAGERFEVWPADTAEAPARPAAPTAAPPRAPAPSVSAPAPGNGAVLAPIPGVIISVAVSAGAEVTVGQELCVLEAMKMKNTIRAPRAGRIAGVQVAAGQTVRHRDVLMAYEAE